MSECSVEVTCRAIGKTAIQRHRCEEMCTERVLSTYRMEPEEKCGA